MKSVIVALILFSFYYLADPPASAQIPTLSGAETLKTQAYQVLDSKCNVCHRKQNPFMIFSPKNMDRRASKIYEQVIVKNRMPKGNEIKLTSEEYSLLKNWLETQLQK